MTTRCQSTAADAVLLVRRRAKVHATDFSVKKNPNVACCVLRKERTLFSNLSSASNLERALAGFSPSRRKSSSPGSTS